MINDPNCLFVLTSGAKPTRCTHPRTVFSSFCEQHTKQFQQLSNRALLQEFGLRLKRLLYPTEKGEVGIRHEDPTVMAEVTNLFNALYQRGYTRQDLGSYLFQPDESGPLDDLIAKLGPRPKWQRFEKFVDAIHRARSDTSTIRYDEKILGKRSGRLRQVDVTVRFRHLYYSFLIAIECKDHRKPIKVETIDAFKTKLEDIGADKGVMVARNHYQTGAIKAAGAYGIELFTLDQITTDWRTVTRIFEQHIPFPRSVGFIPPLKDHNLAKQIPSDFSFCEILFEFTEPKVTRSLADICGNVCEWAHSEKLALPIHIEVHFSRWVGVLLPGNNRSSVQGLSIDLISYLYRENSTVDLPPQITQYKYKDIIRNKQYPIKKDSKKP